MRAKYDLMAWIGYIRFRMGSSGRRLWNGQWNFMNR